MKDNLDNIFNKLRMQYGSSDKKYKNVNFISYTYFKYEQINKNYCIYFFPNLSKDIAKEVFIPDFNEYPNDFISVSIGIIDDSEIWIS